MSIRNRRDQNESELSETAKKNKDVVRRWLTLKDAARYIGVTVRALEGYVRRGQLACYKPFGRLFFEISEMDAVFLASKQEAR